MPLSLYLAQLALNVTWSPLFFGAKKVSSCALLISTHRSRSSTDDVLPLWLLLEQLGLALVNITAMGVAVGATAHSFWPVDPLASKLLWPYLFWVSYATALNTYIYINNPPSSKKDDGDSNKSKAS